MIVIVTDSTACLTKEDAKRLGVVYVPVNYSVELTSKPENFVDLCGDFAQDLRGAGQLSTAQASGGAFMQTFTTLRRLGYEILCISMSSRLSGTYNNALSCANELDDVHIRIVDSLTTAGGLLLLIAEARRMIDEGKTLEETAAEVERLVPDVNLCFSVEDMEPLRKSGRLGSISQSISTILNIRPILRFEDGRPAAKGRVRGSRERLRELAACVPDGAKSVVVLRYECNGEDAELEGMLAERLSCEIFTRPIGPSLAIHVGEGSVGVAWL